MSTTADSLNLSSATEHTPPRAANTYPVIPIVHDPRASGGAPARRGGHGDRCRLAAKTRRIDRLGAEDELARRRAAWSAPAVPPARGYAKLYMDHVLQAEHGCDFDFLRKA